MALLKVGEKDRDGRQKRIEHTGRYLRASRTGLVALRAHVKAAGINLTGNTRHGVRVSTRLAKNTQIAMQNGRFVLRGRYGSDAARFNLSKSGVSVSTKTGIGAINWFRPGRSSAKFAGVQLRGHKAATINAVYLVFAVLGWAIRLIAGAVGTLVQWGVGAWQQARLARERIELTAADVAPAGEQLLAAQGVTPSREPMRDLFAALIALTALMGRGDDSLEGSSASADKAQAPFARALIADVNVAAQSLRAWLGDPASSDDPAPLLGVLHHIARAFAERVDESTRTQTVFAVDDACLALGARTILQDAMLDILVESMAVELTMAGER